MSSIEKLLEVMRKLRDPENGCPWDLEQDFSTIAPYTIEEAYEVADAIERQDWEELRHELGDLLFQVVFYAQMGNEHGYFTFEDIAGGIAVSLVGVVMYSIEQPIRLVGVVGVSIAANGISSFCPSLF